MGHGLVERDHLVDADPAAVSAIGQGDEHAVAINPLDLERDAIARRDAVAVAVAEERDVR